MFRFLTILFVVLLMQISSVYAYDFKQINRLFDIIAQEYVEKINLRSTSIRTLDNFVVNVPNNTIANQAITNVSQAKKRKIDITVGIEYGTPNEKIDRAVQILREIAHDDENITGDGIFSTVEALDDSSINVRLFSYTPEISWFKYKEIKGKVIREIIHRYRAEGISFAFPSTSVYIEKNAK